MLKYAIKKNSFKESVLVKNKEITVIVNFIKSRKIIKYVISSKK
jgi:hypothetical protein